MKKVNYAILILVTILALSGCMSKQGNSSSNEWLAADGSIHTITTLELSREELELQKNNQDTKLKHLSIDDITIIEVNDNQEQNQPLLFLFHEQGGKKEDMLQLSVQFAESGFFCVLMDLPGYGERKRKETIESLEASVLATEDIDLVCDYYRLQPGVDVDTLVLLGISMGGSAVYHYAAFGKRNPTAIVVACTSPDYTTIEDMGSITNGREGEPSWSEKKFEEYTSDHNPITQLDKLSIPSILSFNGLEDDVIPITGSQELETELASRGKRDMDFIYQGGASHEMTPQFEERILPFLINNIQEIK